MRNKKTLWIIATLVIVSIVVAIFGAKQGWFSGKSEGSAVSSKKVTMVVPSSGVDAFKEIATGLRSACPKTDYNIQVLSPEEDDKQFTKVINKALDEKPDYFVAIGSQIATAALSEKNKEKMPPTIAGSISVPSAVSELVNIGINPPRNFPLNIVSQVPQSSYKKVVEILFDIKPSIKKIGIIYNESEMNSNNMRIVLEKIIKEVGAEPLLGAVTSPEDVSKITEKLLRMGAEAIIIPHDKSATKQASTVAKLCNSKNVLTASLVDGIIKDGIMFAVSVPYIEVGKLIGQIIVEATDKGIDLKQMPMMEIKESDLKVFVNARLLEEKGISLSEEMVKLPIVKL